MNPRAQRVRRYMQTNRYKQKYVVVNVEHSASIIVWGCFAGIGSRGSLYFLTPKITMNRNRYMEMLKEKLKASHFPQDGAVCHKSKKVMPFLHQQNFSMMNWPGNSPDLNPIENLWSIIKGPLKKRENITMLPLLIKAIKEIWVTLPKPLMVKLAHSMPTRINMFMESAGQMTKYYSSQKVIFFCM